MHAIRVANDGTVHVAGRENRRVQIFTGEGRFIKPKGNLYVAATGRGMQKLVLKGYQPAAK